MPILAETSQAAPLANRADIVLGNATVRPSLRTVEGPLGSQRGEPRVIQVLLALADARGRVLSREDLLQQCWNSQIVGDDAINRSIAEVRRIARAIGAEFSIETVPRVGYRLNGIDWDKLPETRGPVAEGVGPNRRILIAGGIVGAALVVTASASVLQRNRNKEIDAIIERGRALQASGELKDDGRAEVLFKQAIALDPRRADAWGWLAVVLHNEQTAREAALRAIDIDPSEPNARTVLAYQSRDLEAWTRWEDELLKVLSDAPNSGLALSHLTLFYQGMGRCRDSLIANERLVKIEPYHPGHQSRRALKHWIFGRVGDADKVAETALRLWPRNSFVWNAKMLLLAFTDRAPAALALLNDVQHRPERLTDPAIRSWQAGLDAINSRNRADIDRAVKTCTASASLAPGLAANAIMLFSYLNEMDAAYRVAEGLFENRGNVVQQSRGTGIKDVYSASSWGRTQFLFIPATKAFRDDRRFPDLCKRMGHVAYWKQRGVWPDTFVRGAIDPRNLS